MGLTENDFNVEGNAFAKDYYKRYMGQYDRVARARLPTAYHVGDSWANYDAVSKFIDKAYSVWRSKQAQAQQGGNEERSS